MISAINSMEQIFELKSYDDVFKEVRTFSRDALNYYFYIKIPINICKYVELVDISDITSSIEAIDYINHVKRDCRKPWISVESKIFDLSSGMHTYRFQFVDTTHNNSFYLYMSYSIQDNNPDKPYIYMNREKGSDYTDDICNSFK